MHTQTDKPTTITLRLCARVNNSFHKFYGVGVKVLFKQLRRERRVVNGRNAMAKRP